MTTERINTTIGNKIYENRTWFKIGQEIAESCTSDASMFLTNRVRQIDPFSCSILEIRDSPSLSGNPHAVWDWLANKLSLIKDDDATIQSMIERLIQPEYEREKALKEVNNLKNQILKYLEFSGASEDFLSLYSYLHKTSPHLLISPNITKLHPEFNNATPVQEPSVTDGVLLQSLIQETNSIKDNTALSLPEKMRNTQIEYKKSIQDLKSDDKLKDSIKNYSLKILKSLESGQSISAILTSITELLNHVPDEFSKYANEQFKEYQTRAKKILEGKKLDSHKLKSCQQHLEVITELVEADCDGVYGIKYDGAYGIRGHVYNNIIDFVDYITVEAPIQSDSKEVMSRYNQLCGGEEAISRYKAATLYKAKVKLVDIQKRFADYFGEDPEAVVLDGEVEQMCSEIESSWYNIAKQKEQKALEDSNKKVQYFVNALESSVCKFLASPLKSKADCAEVMRQVTDLFGEFGSISSIKDYNLTADQLQNVNVLCGSLREHLAQTSSNVFLTAAIMYSGVTPSSIQMVDNIRQFANHSSDTLDVCLSKLDLLLNDVKNNSAYCAIYNSNASVASMLLNDFSIDELSSTTTRLSSSPTVLQMFRKYDVRYEFTKEMLVELATCDSAMLGSVISKITSELHLNKLGAKIDDFCGKAIATTGDDCSDLDIENLNILAEAYNLETGCRECELSGVHDYLSGDEA